MPTWTLTPSSTSNLRTFALRSSTTGQLLSGKTYSDFTVIYVLDNDTTTHSVTSATMTAGTWASGGIKEIGSSGVYQYGVPDALASETGSRLKVTCSGAIDVDVSIVRTAVGGGAITVIDAADAILTSTSPTTDTDDGTVTIYTGASYTGTGQGIGKSKSWTGDDLNNAAATLYVLRQDLYEDPTDATAWTALDTTTLTQSGTTLAAAFNPSDTATAALATGHNGDGSTTYRAHIVATASKTPLWDFQIIVRRGEWT